MENIRNICDKMVQEWNKYPHISCKDSFKNSNPSAKPMSQTEDSSKEIFEYIRKRKNGKVGKVGIILGREKDGKVIVGWSKCNVKKDRFDVACGLKIARDRATLEIYSDAKTPYPKAPLCIHSQLRRFGARCIRYFKNANQLVLPV